MAHPKRRPFQHMMEEGSDAILRGLLPPEWVLRPYKPDYGLDFALELFDFVDAEQKIAQTLGEHVFIQLKSVLRTEFESVRVFGRGNVAKGQLNEQKDDALTIEVIKFQIDTDELFTVETMGPTVPVLLVLVTMDQKRAFFLCLNDLIDKVLIPEDPSYTDKGSKVIYVPVKNELKNNPTSLAGIRFYAKRAKAYAAFTLFEYQRNELEYASTSPQQFEPMLRHFIRLLERLDIWSAEMMKLFEWCWGEVQQLVSLLDHEGPSPRTIAETGRIWTGLVALSHTFEECWREWFLPTYLAQLLSYPEYPPEWRDRSASV